MQKNRQTPDVLRLFASVLLFIVRLHASTGMVSFVTVRTRASSNPNPRIWYRVPSDYRAVPGRAWRTLVIFGGRNCGGSNEVSNAIGWAKWADDHGVFLVAPGLRLAIGGRCDGDGGGRGATALPFRQIGGGRGATALPFRQPAAKCADLVIRRIGMGGERPMPDRPCASL